MRRAARTLAAHPHLTAAGLLALLVLAELWPALLGGRPLLALTVLYESAPWHRSVPADATSYYNPLLGDIPTSFYPWDVLARRLLHAGTFPAWNPHALAGTPLLANPEVGWLSPFKLLVWILPLNYALGLAAAVKLWLAGFGTYLLARELRLGFWPGMLAGVSFALCAFNLAWLTHGAHVSVAVMLPWTLWLVERILRHGRPADGLALAAVVVVVLTGGHPGTQLHVLSGGVLYGLARALATRDADRRRQLRRGALVGAGLAVGALIAAVVLLPATVAAESAVGAAARHSSRGEFSGTELTFSAIRAVLLPDWWGRPSEQILEGPSNYGERALYAGSATAVLALAALLAPGAWRRKAPFALLGALGLAVGLKLPGLYDLVVNAPLFDRVQNQRLFLWFLLAVAILGAFGLQAILDAPRRQRRAWIAIAAGAAIALALAPTAHVDGDVLAEAPRQLLHRTAEGYQATALLSIVWLLVFLAGLAGVLALARRRGRRWPTGALVALLVALDMLHFAHGYEPMASASKAVPPRTPAIAFLERHAGEGRIAGLEEALPNDWTTVYGLRDARGYDAPQPSLRFYHLWQALTPGQIAHGPFEVLELSNVTDRVLGLLGVRYVVTEPGTRPATAAESVAYDGRDARIIANAMAAPRARVARRIYVAGSERQEIAAVLTRAFDPRRDAVVRGDELPAGALRDGSGTGRVRVVAEQNARVVLEAALSRPGLVVLDDAWARGWTVTVDERPARPLQADVVLRGVVVPAGTHRIVWSYRVPGLRTGLALSLAGLALALAWGGWLLAIRRRERAR